MVISRNFKYLVLAILLSPIPGVFASLVSDVLLLITMFELDFASWVHNIPAFLLSGISRSFFGLFVSLPVVLLYGVPVFYLLKRWNQQNIWMFGLFGLLPTGVRILVSFLGSDQTLESLNFNSISAGAMAGFFIAIFFWLIAVYIPSLRDKEC